MQSVLEELPREFFEIPIRFLLCSLKIATKIIWKLKDYLEIDFKKLSFFNFQYSSLVNERASMGRLWGVGGVECEPLQS